MVNCILWLKAQGLRLKGKKIGLKDIANYLPHKAPMNEIILLPCALFPATTDALHLIHSTEPFKFHLLPSDLCHLTSVF